MTNDSTRKVHIVNPFMLASGGSEWRAIHLQRELAPHAEVTLWSTEAPHPDLAKRYPIRTIGENGHPEGGTVVFIGVWYHVGDWLRASNPRRVVVVYNTVTPDLLISFYRRLNELGFFNIEMVYTSKRSEEDAEGLEGIQEMSLVDTERFRPRDTRPEGPFTIGRLSRDNWEKHDVSDMTLYRELAPKGVRIRVMGGTCLAQEITPHPNIELIPAMQEDAAEFLRTLDCFYYRTSPRIVEAAGRTIMEAMLTGLPVVLHRSGGYREWIQNGVNGYLFDTKDQALKIILRLKENRALCKSIGKAARETMLGLQSPEVRKQMVEFYLR